jgi:tetratricopeptide (TPR) repeat protein
VLRRQSERLRRLFVFAALALLAAPAAAQAPPARVLDALVVAAPATAPAHAALAEGAAMWLRVELADAGLPVQGRGTPPAGAARLGGELRIAEGHAELRLRLEAADGAGSTLAGVKRSGRLLDLGELLQDAAADLLERVQLPAGALREARTPPLEELARAGRALAWLDAGELARARRELANRISSLAAAVVAEIDAAAALPETPAGERARVRLAAGDVAGARPLVAAEPGPEDDARAVLAAAELAREQNNPRRERELLARAVALAPDDAEAQLAYGRSLAAVSPAEARPVLERAARLRADDPEPLEALAALPGADAAPLLAAADRAAGRLELARAERLYEQSAEAPGLAAESRRRSGDLHLAVGDAERARLAYERAVELGGSDTRMWKGLARARRAGRDPAGAEAALREALARDPDDAEALRELGELQLEGGRAAEARPALERALALAPGDGHARLGLARALHQSGAGERAAAVLAAGEANDADELRAAAELHLERGDRAAAGRALERALELDPGDPELHEALADLRQAEGATGPAALAREQAFVLGGEAAVDGLAAQAAEAGGARAAGFDGPAFLAQLAASFPTRNDHSRLPIARVALLGLRGQRGARALAEQALAPQRLDLARLESDLAAALATRFELAPASGDAPGVDLARALAPAPGRGEIARINAELGTHAVFVARVIRADDEPDWRGAFAGRGLEVRMLLGADADVAALLANAQSLAGVERAYRAWNPVALVLYALVGLALLARVVRGWGTLVVRLEYERLGPSFFTARVSRKPGKVKATARDRDKGQRRFRQRIRELGRYQRTLVGHEARFGWLPAREWYVAVHGLLEHPISKDVIGRYFDEKGVRVPRRGTASVTFDFRATECSLEVSVVRRGAAVERAAVALEGVAGSLRYTHAGVASFALGKGRHTVLVGDQGRVLARKIRIEVLEPTSLRVELEDENGLVFDGCPAAVEPYLAGAREAAAAQLELAGQADVARRLRGDAAAARGDRTVAAELFEQSGRWEDAAQAWLAQRRPERAARCYERLGQPTQAAETWRAAGELARAGRAFEEAGEYDAAIECYGRCGERERLAALLEKTEAFFEAAQVALDEGNADRAIANLQRLSPADAHYAEACRKLAEIFAARGELPLAIGKLDDAVAVAAAEHLADLQEIRAGLLERAERFEEALGAWEEVRRRDFHRPGAAERVEALRERVAAQARAEAETRVRTAPQTAPQQERYEIQGELGRGGMGIVHRAFDKRLGRAIALKRLPESLREHPKVVELFLREARAAAQLNHPNIVTVHDVDQHDGTYFITMECLEGLPLNALLRRHQRFPAATVARIGMQVCAGLGYAHSRSIVHRDIKTANLFMTRDKVVKIMDFGLAKSLAEVRRAGTVIGGTPYYMAPEQALGDSVDGRADLYALGVTFFELATGTLPWTEGDVVYHHRHTPPPDPRERAAGVPDALADLILQLMAKEPAARPASAAEVAARLKALLAPGAA